MSAVCRLAFARSLVCILLALAGCHGSAKTTLPAYSAVDNAAARQILADRAARIHSISATCALKLTGPRGQVVHLDGLIVAAPPDRLRLRTWKLGQTLFDVTLNPDGVWIETPADSAHSDEIVPASLNAARMARELIWFTGGFFTAPGLLDIGPLKFRRNLEDGTAVVCDVDPGTVTPRQYRLLNPVGETLFTLRMEQYRDFNGVIWPTELIGIASAGSAAKTNAPLPSTAAAAVAGQIDIELSDLEFNGELAPQAFVPPLHAEKRP